MSEHHASAIERVLHRIEEHLEDWRKRDAALQAEADASRGRLWAEAAERERLLAPRADRDVRAFFCEQ